MIEPVDSVLQPLKRTTMLDSCTEALRNAILNGEVEPGERINETTFTTKLAVSRTTFRETLRQLEQAGLLVRVPFKGMFVREFSEEEINDLNSLREVLEIHASELVIKKGENTADNLRPLYQIVFQMEGFNAEEEVAHTNALHIAFHRALLSLAGNKLLFSVWNGLSEQFWIAMRISQLSIFAQGEAANFARAHRDIVDAIAAGDVELVRKTMHRHVSHAG